jgi:hypothetical protein
LHVKHFVLLYDVWFFADLKDVNACLYFIDNGSFVESEGVAGEDPEQQLVGEGKCPLTYLCPIHMIIHFPALYN